MFILTWDSMGVTHCCLCWMLEELQALVLHVSVLKANGAEEPEWNVEASEQRELGLALLLADSFTTCCFSFL